MKKIDMEPIYVNFVTDVYKYALFNLRKKEEAEDVTQEAFARFLKKYKKIKLGSTNEVKFILLRIVRNIIYEIYRERKVEMINQSLDEIKDFVVYEETSMDEQIINDEIVEEIKVELDKLDNKTREVLILKIWEGLKFNEIATLGSEKESTVKLIYYRGLEKMKILLTKNRKDKKLFVFGIPIIVKGIEQLKNAISFDINPDFLSSIVEKLIQNNLFFTQKVMNSQKVNILKNILKKFLKRRNT